MKPASGTFLVCIEDEFYHIYRDDTLVGEASLYLYPNSVTVDNIDIDEAYQQQGIGKEIVTQLKYLPGKTAITGDSVPEALSFWARLGATLDWGDMERLEETNDHSLVAFEISWPTPS